MAVASFAVDLGEIVKDGGGYKIEAVDLEHDFDKASFSVIKDSKGQPILLSGVIFEKNNRIEILVPFGDAKPVAYTVRKWKKIMHPDLSKEGEVSEILVDAKSGVFDGLQDGVTDQRLRTVFEQLVRKLEKQNRSGDSQNK